MTGFIYVLHFGSKMSHAGHYVGCTELLRQRLTRHATGHGANIVKHLHEQGGEWQLSTLFTTTRVNLRRFERSLKNQNNAMRYCGLCMEVPAKILGTTQYPICALPFNANSVELRNAIQMPDCEIEYALSGEESYIFCLEGCCALHAQNRQALGFIPFAKNAGIDSAIRRGMVAYAKYNNVMVGYCLYTQNVTEVTIQQIVVDDAFRRDGIGRKLVQMVIDSNPARIFKCNVREDLPANDFWQRIGFTETGRKTHVTSGNTLIGYNLISTGAI